MALSSPRTSRWTAADIPDQAGRTAVVTGANAGIGFEAAKALARRGATVLLACRDVGKAERAAEAIRADVGEARVPVVRLDLASLTSALLGTPASRIVTISSVAHKRGEIRFDDLQSERTYSASASYEQSKLANLLFTYELNDRLESAGAATTALAAHPGNARTSLWKSSSRLENAVISPRLHLLNFWLVQGADRGALPTVRAAVDPSARGGEYYGPDGPFEFTGYPKRVESSDRSRDIGARRRLWKVCEQLTGVSFPMP
jgi:NAD(P)-dependent dehydrogenase (short-subunit alcohol dehydrogenase family)